MGALDRKIQTNRTGSVKLKLTQGGRPVAGCAVRIGQKNHKFQFGSNWQDDIIRFARKELNGPAGEQPDVITKLYLDLFNQVTLPFYWANFEPEQGKPGTEMMKKLASWYSSHDIALKGHPLCWHTLAPNWLLNMTNDEILRTQIDRIKRDVSDFAGIVDTWDVVNEAVIMPIFDKYDNGLTRLCKEKGRIELLKIMFETARETNPRARFLINDFDTSPAYDILVEGCLEAGIEIDVIGIQSHMHQGYWGVEKTERIIERFERFGLPIHFTENTIISGDLMPPEIKDLNDFQVTDWPSTPEGEERQAEEVVTHIKTLLSHPLVESITWWDIKDGAWLNAPSGLIRRDNTPKPSYHALKDLFKGEWWLKPSEFVSDSKGEIEVKGFLGEYELEFEGRLQRFQIPSTEESEIQIDLL
ncbi:endo-1,4-beta-xylanase [Spirochaeta isovalerica]|uniref:Beta-xylanase n=1 Tax=Spirochaeta isovalerica TaxID=150 RepID=A0A841RAH7_9SPIO|nr:endo-1,4-beta-xylanase [Spirochaeta isovalerica]MBB6479929.1 GH35 family endo-1,4-beta-xylanase [Spirochaeta isovalerica]